MKNQKITWEDIEWMLDEKRIELVEDARYLQFMIDELRKIREKYENDDITKCAKDHCFL